MKKKTKRTALPKRVQRAQAEAEKAISRGYKATLDLLPAGPRKVVKDLASQIETTAEDLSERGQKVFKLAEKRRKAFVDRVEKAAKSLEKQSGRALATLDRRTAKLVDTVGNRGVKFVTTVEQVAADVLRPIAKRLDIAPLSELEDLSKRLAQVERKLTTGRRAAA